jgi:O-succinylbenzoate synthase
LGQSVDRAADVHARLATNIRGHAMAKAALEMGSWALEAVQLGRPLSRHLGGDRGGLRTAVPTGISLGLQATPAALVERAQAAVAAGYQKVKLKIEPGRDVAFVDAVRAAVGPAIELMADANAAYTLDDPAHHAALRALDAFGLLMLEQPLGADELLGLATLQAELKTALCLDESITDRSRAKAMLALGSGRIINIKPGRVGGFTESLAIHDLCAAARPVVPVWCGGMLESGIGRAYNVALASLPNFSLPGDLSPSARYWARDVVVPEWTMNAEGLVPVPATTPGLGVEVDTDFIDAITTRVEVLSSKVAMAVA